MELVIIESKEEQDAIKAFIAKTGKKKKKYAF
jgi:hypothetical protein